MKLFAWWIGYLVVCVLSMQHSGMSAMGQETFHFKNLKTLFFVDAVERGDAEKVSDMLATQFQAHSLLIEASKKDGVGRTIRYNLTPLQIAASYSKSLAVMRELIKASVVVNFQDEELAGCPGHGPALLRICSDLKNTNVSAFVALLLHARAKAHVSDCKASALGYRALAGDVESVRLLLEAGALPDEKVKYVMTDTGKEELLALAMALSREIEALQLKPEHAVKVLAYETILGLLNKVEIKVARRKSIKRVTIEQLKKLRPAIETVSAQPNGKNDTIL